MLDLSAADLSVVIISCDEERVIGKTLAAVAPLAGEIILVDSGSKDQTIEIAKSYGAKVYHHDWQGYAAQKNYALTLANKKWILSLDADEIVTGELAKEIAAVLSESTDMSTGAVKGGDHKVAEGACTGYRIPRLLFIGETPLKHGGFYPDAQLRLFINGKGKFMPRLVHESIAVEGPVGRLISPLLHYAYTDFANYANTLDRYARLSAAEFANRENNGWQASKLNEFLHPIWTFSSRYLFRGGFLDGTPGLKANWLYRDYVRKKITYLRQLKSKKKDN